MDKHSSHAHKSKKKPSEKHSKSSNSHHHRREQSSSNHQTERYTYDSEVVEVTEGPDDDLPPPTPRQTMPERRGRDDRRRDKSLPRNQPVKRSSKPIYEEPLESAAPRRQTFPDDYDDVPPRHHHSSRRDRSSHGNPPTKRNSQPIYKEPWGPAAPRRQTLPEDYGYDLPAAPSPPPMRHPVPPSPMHHQAPPPPMHHHFVQAPPPPMHHHFVQAPPPPMHHHFVQVPSQVPNYMGPPPVMAPGPFIPRAKSPTKERFIPRADRGDQYEQELPVRRDRPDIREESTHMENLAE
ncbi:hypothetical protein ACEPAI_3636 [Sanghuangporus weigelae]